MIFKDEDIFKDVLLDCDVFRHLHFLSYLSRVVNSLPGSFIMLDIVEAELTVSKKFIPIVKTYVDDSILIIKKLPFKNKDILTEHFNFLSNNVGAGESACMSVARFNDNVIGSSNLTDIFNYCSIHKIPFLTTLDLLFIAVCRKELSISEFDQAIVDLIANDYRIPMVNFKSFSEKNGALKKWCDQLSN